MDNLYAPWRDQYINERVDGCVFCDISKNEQNDFSNGVLYRDDNCFIVMNKYPYTPGHFMVIPHTHTDRLEILDQKIWYRVSHLAQMGVKMLKEDFGAYGVNLGMNLGECGGAGIAEHIHLHLVPRFPRDTNFITAIGNSRIYSTDFEEIYKRLLEFSKKYFY